LRHLAADQAQIQAAGTGFVADANDVSGNNIPLGGGSYVGDATTVCGRDLGPRRCPGHDPGCGHRDGNARGPVAQGSGAGGSSGQAGDQRPWPRSGVDQPIHKVYVAAFLRARSAGSSVRPTRTSVIEPLTRRFVGPPRDCEAPRSGYTLVGANDDIMTRAVVMHWSGVGRSVRHDRKGQCHAVPHRICSIRVPVMIYWASRTATTCSGFTIGQIGGIMGRCRPAECDADS
jgi:hypothetical protein